MSKSKSKQKAQNKGSKNNMSSTAGNASAKNGMQSSGSSERRDGPGGN